jgi:hypothetical protein
VAVLATAEAGVVGVVFLTEARATGVSGKAVRFEACEKVHGRRSVETVAVVLGHYRPGGRIR